MFSDDELRAAPLQASQAPKDQATVSAGSGDDEPAHEELLDPVVARFVAFRLPKLPAHDGRKSDVKITNAYDAISPYLILKKVYSALIWTCINRNAEKIAKGVWRIDVGYKSLASAAECSKRSLSDAIQELAAHGYILRHPEKWGGGHSSQYYVREEAGMRPFSKPQASSSREKSVRAMSRSSGGPMRYRMTPPPEPDALPADDSPLNRLVAARAFRTCARGSLDRICWVGCFSGCGRLTCFRAAPRSSTRLSECFNDLCLWSRKKNGH